MSVQAFCLAPTEHGGSEHGSQHGGRLAAGRLVPYREATSTELSARQASASDPEVMALAVCVKALNELDERSRLRAVRYLSERYEPRKGGAVFPVPASSALF